MKMFVGLQFFVVALLLSGFTMAATHNIVMTAEYVANGQPAYKMISHSSSEGSTPSYLVEAVIPGPTLFVKEGDVINIELTNNTQTDVGLLIPALSGLNGNQLSAGTERKFPVQCIDGRDPCLRR